MNPFYTSGEDYAEVSGFQSGSGLDWNASAVEEGPKKDEIAEGSGSGDDFSGDIDSSFAELLRSNEKRNADNDENDNGGEKREKEKRMSSTDEDQDDIFGLTNKKGGEKEEKEVKINRRDAEGKNKMSLLKEFFKLMGSNELKVTKRDTKEIEDEFEDTEMNLNDQKAGNAEEDKAYHSNVDDRSRKSEIVSSDRELRIRKREVEDIGDETVPNLSYLDKQKEDNKMVKFENENESVDLDKRSVIDGDNAVRYLEEVNTENLFTKKENEMLEQITRGKRNDNLEATFGLDHGNTKTVKEKKQEFPMIKMATSPRPKRESEEGLGNLENPLGVRPLVENTLNTRDARQADESPLLTKRGLIHSDLNTFNKIRREFNNQKEGIESIFRKINKEKIEKRNVIYDDELDADNFMANFGRPSDHLKEKRFLRNDDLAMDSRPKIVKGDYMIDNIGDLSPLRNEYLDNLMTKRGTNDHDENSKMQYKNSDSQVIHDLDKRSKVNKVRSKVSKESLEVNKPKSKFSTEGSMVSRDLNVKQDNNHLVKQVKNDGHFKLDNELPIGTFAKPTQVSGYWSGLGSKPIFVQKSMNGDAEDVTSGSGADESEEGASISGLIRKKMKGMKNHQKRKEFRQEEIGEIMNNVKNGMKKIKEKSRNKEMKKSRRRKGEKERRKRMDKEDENDEKKNKNVKSEPSKAIVAFDELHEVVSKRRIKDEQRDTKNMKKKKIEKRLENGNKYNKEDDEDDEESGDDDESGEEETNKEIRSYDDDEVVVRTLSATYRENEEIDRRSRIIVKRAPNDSGKLKIQVKSK